MQPSSILTLLLLPIAILATPLPEAFPEAAPEPIPEGLDEAGDLSLPAVPSAGEIFKRSYQTCRIIGAAHVNCRTGPSTKYPAKWVVNKGGLYGFQCYENGECADGNCTWDRIVWDGNICYVNGHYTDNKCTAARLGKCA